ncbi:MAG TPA: ABC transporter substrate-binding protein, partial [Virgibacillus sp.]|nr:ABC transporter substrate-binding protein [Virgibacillus sp.]
IFTIEHAQYFSNGAEGLYASTYIQDPGELFSGEYRNNYIGGLPLEGPDGHNEFTAIQHPIDSYGSFAITSENEHPEATVRWVDHFYSEEGSKMFFMGFEGETFEKLDDEYQFVDDIRNNPDDLNLDQAVSRFLTWPGGKYPAMTKEDYFKGAEGSEASKEAASKLHENVVEEIWPTFSYTNEEHKKVSSFGADIEKYVSEMQDKFITGDESLDDWDNYVETLEGMNIDEYIDIMQNAYERYKED